MMETQTTLRRELTRFCSETFLVVVVGLCIAYCILGIFLFLDLDDYAKNGALSIYIVFAAYQWPYVVGWRERDE